MFFFLLVIQGCRSILLQVAKMTTCKITQREAKSRLCQFKARRAKKEHKGNFVFDKFPLLTLLEGSGKNQILRSAGAKRRHFSEFRFFTPIMQSLQRKSTKGQTFPLCSRWARLALNWHNRDLASRCIIMHLAFLATCTIVYLQPSMTNKKKKTQLSLRKGFDDAPALFQFFLIP